MTDVHLRDSDLSAIFTSADVVSGRGQRRTKLLVRLELLSLIIAAVAGVTVWRVLGPDDWDVLALVSAVFFLASIASNVLRSQLKLEATWYAGRAVAESVKTLAWRYAVGGDPFPPATDSARATQRYLTRLDQILHAVPDITLPRTAANAREVTDVMTSVRAESLATRRQVYKRDRVEDQLGWYVRRSKDHEKSAVVWRTVAVTASFVGIVAAGFKFFNVVEFDLLGVFAAAASAAVAWNQLNQYRNMVSAYTLAAGELSIIRDRIDTVEDARWPSFVSDAEDAISREHIMWLARHGHPSLPRFADDDD